MPLLAISDIKISDTIWWLGSGDPLQFMGRIENGLLLNMKQRIVQTGEYCRSKTESDKTRNYEYL